MPSSEDKRERQPPNEVPPSPTPKIKHDEGIVMSDAVIGPLEAHYRLSRAFREASDQTRVTATHYHIAIANGLGWGFDGMDGVIFALATPLLIKEFGVTLSQWRSGMQVALFIRSRRAAQPAGPQHRPVFADDASRGAEHHVRRLCRGPRRRGVRAERGVGARLLAGGGNVAGAAARPGHRHQSRHLVFQRGRRRSHRHLGVHRLRLARRLYHPGRRVAGGNLHPRQMPGIAILGAHSGPQAAHPNGPGIWRHDLVRRSDWLEKSAEIPLRQLFMPDMWRNTAAATFVACCSTIIYGTVGSWMPLYLGKERGWSASAYGSFHIWWGLIGFLGLLASGLISDRFGRRPAFHVMLAEGAIFLTLWVFAATNAELWTYGLLWSIGFLGFWGPSTILTAEIYPTRIRPTRIRGAGNGFTWAIAWLVGFVLWPFVTVWLTTERTGSFAASFLIVPAAMAFMGAGIWRFTPDHAGKDLDSIAI
jgi:hypothetical protein